MQKKIRFCPFSVSRRWKKVRGQRSDNIEATGRAHSSFWPKIHIFWRIVSKMTTPKNFGVPDPAKVGRSRFVSSKKHDFRPKSWTETLISPILTTSNPPLPLPYMVGTLWISIAWCQNEAKILKKNYDTPGQIPKLILTLRPMWINFLIKSGGDDLLCKFWQPGCSHWSFPASGDAPEWNKCNNKILPKRMGFVTKHTKCCSLASLDPGDGQSCKKPNNVELGENFEIINSPTFEWCRKPQAYDSFRTNLSWIWFLGLFSFCSWEFLKALQIYWKSRMTIVWQ